MGLIPDYLLRYQFNSAVIKLRVLWTLRNQPIATCNDLSRRICDIEIETEDAYNAIVDGCSVIPSYGDVTGAIFEFEFDDSELTFEFIQFRNWLIWINCPWSLIYRISRSFYYYYSVAGTSIESYHVNIRRFILGELRGFVSNAELFELENQLFSTDFGFMLQRMWAFRGFRIGGVPRERCEIWFGAWRTFGWTYDITTFTDWDFDFDSVDVGFSLDIYVVSIPSFDLVQQCLIDYLDNSPLAVAAGTYDDLFDDDDEEESTFTKFKLAIGQFDTENWDGTFHSLLESFKNLTKLEQDDLEVFLRPEFDATLVKTFIFWRLQGEVMCPDSIDRLISFDKINEEIITDWLNDAIACNTAVAINFNFADIMVELYAFLPDEELTFEFITLRNWLIDIGCPRSLVYRISRFFYFKWNFEIESITSYLVEARTFILLELRGYVSEFDFQALEVELFGTQFNFVLQRMWAFRGFRLGSIPRAWCFAWFGWWSNRGYSYDISLFTGWSDFEIDGFPNGFDFSNYPVFDSDTFIQPVPEFNEIQNCLMDYIQSFLGNIEDIFQYNLIVTKFDVEEYDGSLNSIISLFEGELGQVPDFILLPGFNTVLTKIWILRSLRDHESDLNCQTAIKELINIADFDDATFSIWFDGSQDCQGVNDLGVSFEEIQQEIFIFKDNSDLTFEFISLRDWLIFIGCPWSLVYRISRSFYYHFDLSSIDMSNYQLELRRFIFGQLEGFVSDYDFEQLEIALFGEDFGFILQRMWAFRRFRLAGVDRAMCFGWFNFWISYGYDYDITLFTNWDFNGVGWGWPSGFDFEASIVSVPQFDWSTYFVGWQLEFYNWLLQHNLGTNYFIALNSLPSHVTSRFEIELYFIKRLGFGDSCWNTGRSLFASESFRPIFTALTGSEITAEESVPVALYKNIFSPLQMLLNDWITSMEWLSIEDKYSLQLIIACYNDTRFNAAYYFYYHLQEIFNSPTCGFDIDFINRFNTEFSLHNWTVTITRWQIVSLCVSFGFPLEIIYGSLRFFFNLSWTSPLTLEWVNTYVLIGPWSIDIENVVDFNPTFNLDFSNVQKCLLEYLKPNFNDPETIFSIEQMIARFDSADSPWDGTFNQLIAFMDSYDDYFSRPEFDLVLIKMNILWSFSATDICADSLQKLNEVTRFTQNFLSEWQESCQTTSVAVTGTNLNWIEIQQSVYFYISDDDLDFEFITLRNWLIDIGCPYSLVYRVTRIFYTRWTFTIANMSNYMVLVRQFLLEELVGIVSDFDMQALEVGLFGGDFSFVLQRMWAFRGFKLGSIPRAWCAVWFTRWYTYGYYYDITVFTEWSDFEIEGFPSGFNFEDFPSFNQIEFIVAPPSFDHIQKCAVDYFQSFLGGDTNTSQYTLTIAKFDTGAWNGSFNEITEIFENEYDSVPTEIFMPEFDAVITKMWIISSLLSDNPSVCSVAIENLNNYDNINVDNLADWKNTWEGSAACGRSKFDVDLEVVQNEIFYFRPDSDLDFEFIQLRDWLIFIGCPLSLVYRISRSFFFRFNFSYADVDDYQYEVRNFIFAELDGLVFETDFIDLENALFGGSFSFILQRMWAFRGFRLASIPRSLCVGWFRDWSGRGITYDITTYTNWDLEVNGFDFLDYEFNIEVFITSPPQFNWASFYTGRKLAFYNWLVAIQWTTYPLGLIESLNSLPYSITTQFELELYFMKRLNVGSCWTTRNQIFANENFNGIFKEITGLSIDPSDNLPDSLLESVFTPLQMVLNNWLNSITWLSSSERYRLQLAIACFEGVQIGSAYEFYDYLQAYFETDCGLGLGGSFITRFNLEFENPAWIITITRWQVVSLCIGFRFPLRIIYGSLNIFFNLGWTPGALTIEWISENVLITPWNFEIEGIVDPNPTFPITFTTIQQCIIDYIFGIPTDSVPKFDAMLAISQFNEDTWDGSFNAIAESIGKEDFGLMEFFLRPAFDLVLIKINILWRVRQISLCADSVKSLNVINSSFNQDNLNIWLQSCDSTADIVVSLDEIQTQLYFFKSDEELDFEFITLRDWLIDIGCPYSLIWRISRAFYFRWTLNIEFVTDYLILVRRFILGELEGLVLESDLTALEASLFGTEISFVLQRMWAFRGFKIGRIPRIWCFGWFNVWYNIGWQYDITIFTEWSLTSYPDFGVDGEIFDFSIYPDFNFDDFIVQPPAFDDVQQCMIDYFNGFLGGDIDTFRYSLLILNFATDQWDGTFNAITDLFKSEFGEVPSTLFLPNFDQVLTKMWILFNLRGQAFCNGAVEQLSSYNVFTGDVLANWLGDCPQLSFNFNFEDIQTSLYFFRDDSDLTFEFISLRDWLIFIGCPMSLVYRISWSFYWRFEYTFADMSDYQLEMRRFIFAELRGFVTNYDFEQLEVALFGNGFGFVLQRMWAFRGFRLAGVNRAMCLGWFNFWISYGYDYDITGFTNWDFDGVGWTWPSGFDFNGFIVSVPQFDWTVYLTGFQLELYNLVISVTSDQNVIIALNSLPESVTTRFEIENYFVKRIGTQCWSDGNLIFDNSDFTDLMQLRPGYLTGFSLPADLETIFTPLQMVLNNWLESIDWLDIQEKYKLQLFISCFEDEDIFNGYNNFFFDLQNFFETDCGFAAGFIDRFNAEFWQPSWSVTITRWQIVASCVAFRFPIRVIYGSLRFFFDLGFDTESLSIEWVYENVLTGPWFIDISETVDFEPSFNPVLPQMTTIQLCIWTYVQKYVSAQSDLWSYGTAISRFDSSSWDGTFNGLEDQLGSYYQENTFFNKWQKLRTENSFIPVFDVILIKLRILWKIESFGIDLSPCQDEIQALNLITTFDQVILTNWLNTCSQIQNANIEIDFNEQLTEVYFSKEDTELTFEYIQLRDWLISIGCPLSLIWRLERVYINFDFPYGDSGKVENFMEICCY